MMAYITEITRVLEEPGKSRTRSYSGNTFWQRFVFRFLCHALVFQRSDTKKQSRYACQSRHIGSVHSCCI